MLFKRTYHNIAILAVRIKPYRTLVMAMALHVTLGPADIPGADLEQPFEMHAMPALRWWLLCRNIRAPSSWKNKNYEMYSEQRVLELLICCY